MSPSPREAFLQGLRELGYVEGQTFALVERYAEGRQERLPELAVELVRLGVDIIFAGTSAAVKAADGRHPDDPYRHGRGRRSRRARLRGEPRAARRQRDRAEHDEY